MKRIKVAAMMLVVAMGILSAGNLVVQAGGKYCRLDVHSVAGETYAGSSYSGMARTVSSSYDVYTSVHGFYEYYDPAIGACVMQDESDGGLYGSEVTFPLPNGAERATMIFAEHYARYGSQKWECETVAYFDK